MTTIAPFASPLYVMLKPAGSLCNLACKYCYYLEKQKLYPLDKSKVISDELLEEFIKQYIEAQTMPQVLFTWHGGETLMRPISFYKRALELQQRYAHGRQIDNCIQTNGTLLTDEWCEFFKENHLPKPIVKVTCFNQTKRTSKPPQDCDAYTFNEHIYFDETDLSTDTLDSSKI